MLETYLLTLTWRSFVLFPCLLVVWFIIWLCHWDLIHLHQASLLIFRRYFSAVLYLFYYFCNPTQYDIFYVRHDTCYNSLCTCCFLYICYGSADLMSDVNMACPSTFLCIRISLIWPQGSNLWCIGFVFMFSLNFISIFLGYILPEVKYILCPISCIFCGSCNG